MSTHSRFEQLAAADLDFDLRPADADELRAHLDTCTACRRFGAGIRADQELFRARHLQHAPDRVRQAVVTAATRPPARSRARATLSLVSALAIVVALLSGWAWLNRPRMSGPAQQPVRAWAPLGDVTPFAGGWVADVASTGANLIAVGSAPDGDHPIAAAWLSPDGLAWQRLPVDPSFGAAQALNVVQHGDTLLVLGGGVVPGSALSPGTVRVLVTHEQRTCETCPAPTSVPSSVASIAFPHPVGTAPLFAAVAAGGSGFVFVGTELADPGAGDASVGAIVATSPDGLTWTFNEPTAPVFADGAMRGVAAGPSGYVAVGQVQLVPAVWTSADGRSWTQLPGAITPATASLRSVASGPGGFVAVGDDSGAATSWTSADGQAWHAAPRSPELDGARMARVAWTGSSYLAIGESGGNGAAWASADGLAWARLDTGPVLAQAQMWAAASIQSRDVLFATDPTNRIVVAVGTEPANP